MKAGSVVIIRSAQRRAFNVISSLTSYSLLAVAQIANSIWTSAGLPRPFPSCQKKNARHATRLMKNGFAFFTSGPSPKSMSSQETAALLRLAWVESTRWFSEAP